MIDFIIMFKVLGMMIVWIEYILYVLLRVIDCFVCMVEGSVLV